MKSIIGNKYGLFLIDGGVYADGKPAIVTAESKTKEAVFAELVKDLVRKEDHERFPNSVFWFNKDKKFMFEYDKKNNYFWCSYNLVWLVFEYKFGMKYDGIKTFMNVAVEEYFNCKGIITDFGLRVHMVV